MSPLATAGARPTSAATFAAREFVAAHRVRAADLGAALAEHVDDPEGFAVALHVAFAALADPAYIEGEQRIAPGLGPVAGVRLPLLEGLARSFRAATRRARPDSLLWLADRLLREQLAEARLFAIGLLGRTLASDAERTWQLLRRVARDAGDWITVDSLAHPVGRGILEEPYRWAELEQLVFSPSRWERRLVGSTLATLPFIDRSRGRRAEVAARGLDLLGQLIGDDAPEVQKALAWALRSLTLVDAAAVTAFCRAETERARADADGARAWVIRDALVKLAPAEADRLRARLAGIRRRPGAPSTSRAARMAAAFLAGLPAAADLAEPPL